MCSDSRHILSVAADCCMKVTDVQTGMVMSSVTAEEEQRYDAHKKEQPSRIRKPLNSKADLLHVFLLLCVCVQVFLLGRELCAVWDTVWGAGAVGPAQQHSHPEDPCTLRSIQDHL